MTCFFCNQPVTVDKKTGKVICKHIESKHVVKSVDWEAFGRALFPEKP